MSDNTEAKETPSKDNDAVTQEAVEVPCAPETLVDGEPNAGGDNDSEESAEGAPVATPEENIAALEAECADLKDRLLRAVAETENVRRRAQRDKEDTARYAVTNFGRETLAVADNLRRALDSVDEETRKSNGAVENLMIGVEMTERELMSAFERVKITRMEPLGQRFDPNVHEAMFEYEDPSHPAGSVGQVIEAGYMIHDRPLRPAKVGVTKGGPVAQPKAAADTPGDESAANTAYEAQSDAPGGQIDEEL